MKTLCLALTLLTGSLLTVRADPDAPEETARAFYVELRRLKVSGLPQGDDWDAIRPFLSEALTSALELARKEQVAFLKENPGEKPPWIEGDLFGSLFEGPQQFSVGKGTIDGNFAEVPVECVHTESGDSVKWVDTLILLRIPEGWRIDDVRYGGTWDFAAQGTLKQALEPLENQ